MLGYNYTHSKLYPSAGSYTSENIIMAVIGNQKNNVNIKLVKSRFNFVIAVNMNK